jgi:hypothetical protein
MPQEVDGSGEMEDGGNLPSTNSNLPPVIQKLRDRPRRRYNPIWPEGTRQPFTQELAQYYFDLVSTSDTSLLQLLRDHPELPPHKQLDYWRRHKPEFAEGLKQAHQDQAHFLAHKCLDLVKNVDAKNAHAARIKFDVYRWLAAKLHPAAYAEKPLQTPTQTVNVGIAISQERLADLRSRLEPTRSALALKQAKTAAPSAKIKSNGSHS